MRLSGELCDVFADAVWIERGFDDDGTGAGVLAQNPTPATRRGTQGEAASSSAEEQSVPIPPETSSWDFTRRPSGAGGPGGGGGRGQTQPDVAIDLADAMRKNPRLKVFSANGYFDLATPFFNTEYDLHHMLLPPAVASNVQFGYYPAGHMVYLSVEALKMLKGDMAKFYGEAERR